MTAPTAPAPLNLGRVRTGARATLALGIGASLAANVLAAQPTVIGRVIAAWPPVALLVTVELLSRVPVAPGWLSRLRVLAAGGIAGIAAWVSYWHMVAVALEYGEASVAAHLLPFSVDGLVVVASVCLVELARRTGPAMNAEPGAGNPTSTLDPPEPKPATTPRPRARRREPVRSSTVSKRDLVLGLAEQHPDWTQAQLAETAECSIRTVRRHLTNPPAPAAAVDPVASDLPALPDAQPPAPVLVAANGHTSENNQ